MNTPYLNYDKIAQNYNQRYPTSQQWERGAALLNLAKRIRARRILEVGSGTGYWLNLLGGVTNGLFGLDYSMGMLRQARGQSAPLKLARGTAVNLPLQNQTFDLLYCVDAIHHFGDHRAFVVEAFRVLQPGGVFAVIGHDPHGEGASNWYIYEYFDTVYDTDLRRYPSGKSLMRMMEREGFEDVSSEIVEQIRNVHVGDSVLKDPFLKHNATSQLALLDDGVYQAGLERIRQSLDTARERGERITFRSEINVKMFLGRKR